MPRQHAAARGRGWRRSCSWLPRMTPLADPRRSLAAAACAALLALPAPGRAGDLADLDVEELLALEAVVTSASKHEEPPARAPASVTVVTAEEIRDQGK